MMDINEAKTAVNNVLEPNQLGKVKKVYVTVTTVKTKGELDTIITSFTAGWLCLTGEVVIYSGEGITVDGNLLKLNNDIILSGELVSNDGNESLHIRQGENCGWVAYHIIDGEGENSEECLMFKESFVAAPIKAVKNNNIKRVKYKTYWKDEGGAYKPHVSRFTGFE